MRRFLRIRLLFVLIALLLVPTLVLPYAERLRAEWARLREPRVQAGDEPQWASREALLLLEELEQANYVERARLARSLSWASKGYESPIIPIIGCKFPPLPEEPNVVAVEDVPATDAAARQERFLRSLAEVEKLGLPEFDEFDQGPMLSLPTEEYWAELKARDERRKTNQR